MRYSFTGPTNIQPRHEALVHHILVEKCEAGKLFITGAAKGVDSIAALHAKRIYPDAQHWLIVPGSAPSNAETLADLMAFDKVVVLPDAASRAETYMNRNQWMVDNSEELVGFPYTYTEQVRSGEWATIRRMIKAGKPHHLYPLALHRELLPEQFEIPKEYLEELRKTEVLHVAFPAGWKGQG